MIFDILKLGNPELYETSTPITREELPEAAEWRAHLHDTLMNYRARYGAGRAIAAPQIGYKKRMIYLYMDKPYVMINPVLTFPDEELYTLMDDCMSFPGLTVRVERHRRAKVQYRDLDWNEHEMALEDDWSELVQHEYDHLDGILATMRAVDNKSLFLQQIKRDL